MSLNANSCNAWTPSDCNMFIFLSKSNWRLYASECALWDKGRRRCIKLYKGIIIMPNWVCTIFRLHIAASLIENGQFPKLSQIWQILTAYGQFYSNGWRLWLSGDNLTLQLQRTACSLSVINLITRTKEKYTKEIKILRNSPLITTQSHNACR